jgi:hypothetical protein
MANVCSHLAHRHAIGEEADVIETHAMASLERSVHRVGLERLDPDDAHVGAERLDVPRDAGDEPAPADRHEDRAQTVLTVPQDLRADRPLPRDHQRIVERVDEAPAGLRHQGVTPELGIRIAVAVQLDVGSHRSHRVHLDLRRRLRHHDRGRDPQPLRRERDTLRMISGARRNDPPGALGLGQVGDPVVGAAQLEAEHGLLILTLDEHRIAQPA